MQDKYVVIPKERWEAFLGEDNDLWYDEAVKLPITGGHFVVREQDVFAPAGLYAYAANIRTVLEVLDRTAPCGTLDEEDYERLRSLADDLAHTADKWQAGETAKKIPD